MLIAIFALVFAQSVVFARFWTRGLDMKLGLSVENATEGDYITVREVLENAKLLPLPWINVKFQVSGNLVFEGTQYAGNGADTSRSELFSVGPYKRVTRSYKVLCAERGYYTIKSMSVTGQDLLMSRRRVTNFSCGESLTVYPAALCIDPFSPAYRRVMGSVRARRFTNPDPFEFRGIREYLPTDSLRSVNHRASAKTGELMVNMFEPTTSRRVTLWLATDPYSATPLPQVYEDSIRLTAAFAEMFIADGLTAELKTGAMNILSKGQRVGVQGGAGENHLTAILEALALIDLSQPCEPAADILAAADTGEDSVHVLICPYDGEDAELAVEKLRGAGQDVIWILPHRKDTHTRLAQTGSTFYWEVS